MEAPEDTEDTEAALCPPWWCPLQWCRCLACSEHSLQNRKRVLHIHGPPQGGLQRSLQSPPVCWGHLRPRRQSLHLWLRVGAPPPPPPLPPPPCPRIPPSPPPSSPKPLAAGPWCPP